MRKLALIGWVTGGKSLLFKDSSECMAKMIKPLHFPKCFRSSSDSSIGIETSKVISSAKIQCHVLWTTSGKCDRRAAPAGRDVIVPSSKCSKPWAGARCYWLISRTGGGREGRSISILAALSFVARVH